MQRFCAFLIKPLFVGILMLPILAISCASTPRQVNLKKTSISQIRSVAVTVRAPNPGVINERLLSPSFPGPPLFLLIDSAVATSKDHTLSESARNAVDLRDLENRLGNHFIENIRHANLFDEIQYFPDQLNDNKKQFLCQNYYALLEINIRDLSFVRTAGNFRLFIDANGTMMKQADKEILWSRQETIISKEAYTLAFVTTYSDELKKVFYLMFESLADRLAADLLYLD